MNSILNEEETNIGRFHVPEISQDIFFLVSAKVLCRHTPDLVKEGKT